MRWHLSIVASPTRTRARTRRWVEPAGPAHRAGAAGETHHHRSLVTDGYREELNPSYGLPCLKARRDLIPIDGGARAGTPNITHECARPVFICGPRGRKP